jgi:flavin reductase (DIM6/NTAB) family NADH-FMN oxidoreductase RutF
MAVGPDQFRDALRSWASGVSVVTTERDGGIQGITVSSFASLSLDPPLVLICIDRGAVSHGLIARRGVFAVNLLREDQAALANDAAGRRGPQGNRLEKVAWRRAVTGAPILKDCLAWLDCLLVDTLPGGDHSIFVGRVEAAGRTDGRPLLWFGSDYQRLAPRRRSRSR